MNAEGIAALVGAVIASVLAIIGWIKAASSMRGMKRERTGRLQAEVDLQAAESELVIREAETEAAKSQAAVISNANEEAHDAIHDVDPVDALRDSLRKPQP